MKPRSHLLDVYGVHLHVATDKRQLAQLRRKYPKIERNDGWGGTTTFSHAPKTGPDQLHVAIWLDIAGHKGDQGELLDTCAHEATHAACLILDDCGAKYDGNSEPLAYLVGWLTRWIFTSVTEEAT